MDDSVQFRNTGIIGVAFFFDPFILDIDNYKKLKQIYKDVFGEDFKDNQFKRVAKLYSILISNNIPSTETNHSYFKEILKVAENQSHALMNISSEDKLIKFVSNFVIRFNEIKYEN